MIIVTADAADARKLLESDEVNAILGALELMHPGSLAEVEKMREKMADVTDADRILFSWDGATLNAEHHVKTELGWKVEGKWTGKAQ